VVIGRPSPTSRRAPGPDFHLIQVGRHMRDPTQSSMILSISRTRMNSMVKASRQFLAEGAERRVLPDILGNSYRPNSALITELGAT